MTATELLTLGLTNAVLATALAVCGWVLTRVWKNPHVASVVWLVVLLKLVTPPIVTLPIVWSDQSLVANEGEAETVSELRSVSDEASAVSFEAVAVDSPFRPDPIVEGLEAQAEFEQATDEAAGWPLTPGPSPEGEGSELGEAVAAVEVASSGVEDATPVVEAGLVMPIVVEEPVAAELAPVVGSKAAVQKRDWPLARIYGVVAPVVLAVWWIGGLVVGGVAVWRVLKFRRLLRVAAVNDGVIAAVASDVAARMGLRRRPDVRSVSSNVGPLVWAGGIRPTVVVPRPLWDSIGEAEREILLAHELAHVARRDHWVRRVEAVVLALYWWLPTAWVAVRRREVAAELCCDALVLKTYPHRPRAYAEVLFHAVSQFSVSRPVVLASGLGRISELKERLAMIVHDRIPKRPRMLTRLGLLVLGGAALFVSAQFVKADPKEGAAESGPVGPVADAPSAKRLNASPFAESDAWPDPFGSDMHPRPFDEANPFGGGSAVTEYAQADPSFQLPQFGAPRARTLESLKKIISSKDEPVEVKVQAMRSYGRLARGLDDEKANAEKVLLEVIKGAKEDRVTLAAAVSLHLLGSSKGIEMMWSLLETSNEPETLLAIVIALEKAKAVPPTVESVIAVVTRQTAGLIEGGGAMGMGGGFGGPRTSSAGALLARLGESAEGIRRLVEAIETINADVGDGAGMSSTSGVGYDGADMGGMPGMMGSGMGGFAAPNPREMLLAILREVKPETDEITDALVAALSSKDAGVRAAAAQALGNPVEVKEANSPFSSSPIQQIAPAAMRGASGIRSPGAFGGDRAAPAATPARADEASAGEAEASVDQAPKEMIRKEAFESATAIKSLQFSFVVKDDKGWHAKGEFFGEGERFRVTRQDLAGISVFGLQEGPATWIAVYDGEQFQARLKKGSEGSWATVKDELSREDFALFTPQMLIYAWLRLPSDRGFRWDSLFNEEQWQAQFAKATYMGRGGEEENIEIIEFPQREGVSTPYIDNVHFAPELGYLPFNYHRRVETTGKLLSTMQVTRFRRFKIDGKQVTFPTEILFNATGADGGGSHEQSMTITVDEGSLKVNEDIDDAIFTLKPGDADYQEVLNRLAPETEAPVAQSAVSDKVRAELIKSLSAAAQDEKASPETRAAALESLAKIVQGTEIAAEVAAIAKRVLEQASDASEKAAAAATLQRLGDPRGIEALWGALAMSKPEESQNIIERLSVIEMPVPATAEGVVALAWNVARLEKELTRSRAFSEERNTVPSASTNAGMTRLQDVGNNILKRLYQSGQGVSASVAAIESLKAESLAAGTTEEDKEIERRAKARLLALLKSTEPTNDEIATALAQALSSEVGEVRKAAAEALGNVQGTDKLDENDREVRSGRNIFRLLDTDDDGRVSPEELSKLQRLRPGFEKAGVDLNREMSADEFVRAYLRSVAE